MPRNRARRRPMIITGIGAGKVGKRVLSLPANVQSTPAFRPRAELALDSAFPFYLFHFLSPNGRRIYRAGFASRILCCPRVIANQKEKYSLVSFGVILWVFSLFQLSSLPIFIKNSNALSFHFNKFCIHRKKL